MLPGERHLFGHRRLRHRFAVLHIIFYLPEDPGVAEARAAYHDAVDPVGLESPQGGGAVGDVAVADDRDVHAGVVLHLADQRPVRGALVHLAARAPVDRERLYARVLQAFGEFDYDLGAVVPAEAGLHRDGFADGFHHSLGDRHHLVGVAHHARTGAASGYLGDRAAEVDVYHVGPVASGYLGGAVGHSCGLHHGLGDVAVDLYAHGRLLFGGAQFRKRLGGVAYQAVGGDELGIHHVGPLFAAEQPEGEVGDVFHRSQQQRAFAKVEISDFHRLQKYKMNTEKTYLCVIWKISTGRESKGCASS